MTDEPDNVLDDEDPERCADASRRMRELVEQYGDQAEDMTFCGLPLSALSREELKAVIAFQGTYIRDVHEIRVRQRALMRGLREVRHAG